MQVQEPDNHRIRVDVATSYVEEQSSPTEQRFVFAYTITIRNEGTIPARLLTRHWVITDANGKVQEVRGEGVVGESRTFFRSRASTRCAISRRPWARCRGIPDGR